MASNNTTIKKIISDLEPDQINKLSFKEDKVTTKAKLDIGLRCNADCYFCYYKSSLKSPIKPVKTIINAIDKLIDAGFTEIELSGGEPTIHPDFINILEYLKKCNIKSSFLTNAIAIDEKMMQAIYEVGVNDILFSVQGLEKTHDKILGYDGAFENILRVQQWSKEAGIQVRINTVVATNLKELPILWTKIKSTASVWNLLPLNHWGDADVLKRMPYVESGMMFNRLLRARAKEDPIINIRYFPYCFIEPIFHDNIFNYYKQYFDKLDWHPFFMSDEDLSEEKLSAFQKHDINYYKKDLLQRRTMFFKKEKSCLDCQLSSICDGFKK